MQIFVLSGCDEFFQRSLLAYFNCMRMLITYCEKMFLHNCNRAERKYVSRAAIQTVTTQIGLRNRNVITDGKGYGNIVWTRPSGHTTLKWRRINVDATWSYTSHRRWYDVILMLCACWGRTSCACSVPCLKCPRGRRQYTKIDSNGNGYILGEAILCKIVCLHSERGSNLKGKNLGAKSFLLQ